MSFFRCGRELLGYSTSQSLYAPESKRDSDMIGAMHGEAKF
jgi:hypothetical protein